MINKAMKGMGGVLGKLKIPTSLMKMATGQITNYLERLRKSDQNPKGLPVWINVYNKQRITEDGEEEAMTIINFACLDVEQGRFTVMEKHSPDTLMEKNPMIAAIAPVVTKLLGQVQQEQGGGRMVLSILNEYPENPKEKPYTVIRFTNQSTNEVVKQFSMAEIGENI